jgi:hypothetical protein
MKTVSIFQIAMWTVCHRDSDRERERERERESFVRNYSP